MNRNKALRFTFFVLVTLFLLLVVTFFLPSLFFPYKISYGQCTVHSDQPISDKVKAVLSDAMKRVSTSELYEPVVHFNIYLCNKAWRFALFSFGQTNAGAVTHYHLTGNIFIRQCNIDQNKIIPPTSWKFSLHDRPLSYYFAHEMTHRLQARYRNRPSFREPRWLTEGYADYIAKSTTFDFDSNLAQWKQSSPELDPSQGLYKYFNLLVAYLLDRKGLTIKEVYTNPPEESDLRTQLNNIINEKPGETK